MVQLAQDVNNESRDLLQYVYRWPVEIVKEAECSPRVKRMITLCLPPEPSAVAELFVGNAHGRLGKARPNNGSS